MSEFIQAYLYFTSPLWIGSLLIAGVLLVKKYK